MIKFPEFLCSFLTDILENNNLAPVIVASLNVVTLLEPFNCPCSELLIVVHVLAIHVSGLLFE
jgi:hypothetical protein